MRFFEGVLSTTVQFSAGVYEYEDSERVCQGYIGNE